MTASKPIKTGVLSFGMSGKLFHAPFLNAHHGFELCAVVERTHKKAHLFYPTIRSYDSTDLLFGDDNLELIVVNTPNATHYEFALKALKAHRHVLMEKPFTVTSRQAQHLFRVAEANNCRVLPYQNRRYDSDLLSVKQILDSGKLGELIEVHMRFDRYRYGIGPKVAKETKVPGCGLLYDLGPHLLDAAISLFGLPVKWTKTLGHFRPNTQVDDYAHIHLCYPNELNVFITASLLVADAPPAFILHGSKGSYCKQRSDVQEGQLLQGINPEDLRYGIEVLGHEGNLTTISEDGIKHQQKIPSIKSNYLNVFEDVYQNIRFNKPYPVLQQQIIKQLEILEA